MPRFFFHIEGDGAEILDSDGVLLPDCDDVPEVCRALIDEVSVEEPWLDAVSGDYWMRVTDEAGKTLLIVQLGRLTKVPEEIFAAASDCLNRAN